MPGGDGRSSDLRAVPAVLGPSFLLAAASQERRLPVPPYVRRSFPLTAAGQCRTCTGSPLACLARAGRTTARRGDDCARHRPGSTQDCRSRIFGPWERRRREACRLQRGCGAAAGSGGPPVRIEAVSLSEDWEFLRIPAWIRPAPPPSRHCRPQALPESRTTAPRPAPQTPPRPTGRAPSRSGPPAAASAPARSARRDCSPCS